MNDRNKYGIRGTSNQRVSGNFDEREEFQVRNYQTEVNYENQPIDLTGQYASVLPRREEVNIQHNKNSMARGGRKSSNHSASGMTLLDQSQANYSALYEEYKRVQQEYDEARSRALQMEKTMRWWSDCTSNWRDKWTTTKDERNKAREENRVLKTQLNNINEQFMSLKLDLEKITSESDDLKQKLNSYSNDSKSSNIPVDILIDINSDETSNTHKNDSDYKNTLNGLLKPLILYNESLNSSSVDTKEDRCASQCAEDHEDRVLQLQIKVEELEKLVENEKSEKEDLHKKLNQLDSDYRKLQEGYEKLLKENCAKKDKPSEQEITILNPTESVGIEETLSDHNVKTDGADVNVLQMLLAQRTQESQESIHKYHRCKRALRDTSKELDQFRQHAAACEQKTTHLKAHVEDIKSELLKSHNELGNKTAVIQRYKSENDNLRSKISTLLSHLQGNDARTVKQEFNIDITSSISSLQSFEENELKAILNLSNDDEDSITGLPLDHI